jgi:transposase InsO family protein
VRFARIDAEKAVPISVHCAALGVSRAGFYAWKRSARPHGSKRKNDCRKVSNERLIAEIKAIHEGSRGTYGSPRVHRSLRAKGFLVGRNRVVRLMRQEGLRARKKRRFKATTDSNHPSPIAPNVLEQNFFATAPNTKWVTDVTYVWTREGWLYLAAIIDLFSRRVIGWATSSNNDRTLALDALERAVVARKPGRGLIHHSDRGSVYASHDYGNALTRLGAIKSMSRKGNCWDNAVAESFFATLKGECLDNDDFETRHQAVARIADFIDDFYNPRVSTRRAPS